MSPVVYMDENVVTDMDIHNDNWAGLLKTLCDKEGMQVLEIDFRVVTGRCFRNLFEKAAYVEFGYYMGENVEVPEAQAVEKTGGSFSRKEDS